MAIVVNNPPAENTNNNAGFLIGAILLLLVVVLFFIYGLPYLRNLGTPQINVPDHINVNVQNQGGKY